MKALNISLTSDFAPEIDYDDNKKKLVLYLNPNKIDKITLYTESPQKINKEENKRLFNSLTKIQKLGIIFLICCIKSNKIPLIQGETASGKSYLIQIFTKILGQSIILYQITSNSDMSILTGQDIIKTKIESDELKKLEDNYEKVQSLIKQEKKFNKIKENQYNSIFQEIIKKLNKSDVNLSDEERQKLKEAKDNFYNIISLPGRLEHKNSSFINAALTGKWVCFDGIEMGHSILFDSIASLCNANPQLNIISSKEIKLNKDNIKDKFKFFLTFNPSNLGKKSINQILFNSCARFSLISLDTEISDSTVIIYNSRYENEMNKKVWVTICSKLACCHKLNENQSEIYSNLMAGGVKFSPRHLTFIGNDGKKYNYLLF